MLAQVVGSRLRAVERFAWHSADGSTPNLHSGSVHLWFDDGRCAHLDVASDWTLRWSVTGAGDTSWLKPFDYECYGRWIIRDASAEEPFKDARGKRLTSAHALLDEVGEVTGTRLVFEGSECRLTSWEGEIDTTPQQGPPIPR